MSINDQFLETDIDTAQRTAAMLPDDPETAGRIMQYERDFHSDRAQPDWSDHEHVSAHRMIILLPDDDARASRIIDWQARLHPVLCEFRRVAIEV